MRPLFLSLIFLCFLSPVKSQVLISLILGEDLNSGTIEFGLDGGINLSDIEGLDGKMKTNFNLGFYFDIKTKNPKWLFHTGVMVRSSLGTSDLPVYNLNDAGLDSSFKDGNVKRSINYFNVPIMMKYKFTKKIFSEAGIMPSLKYSANDEFVSEINGEDLKYNQTIKNQINPIDFGIIAGVGYRLMGGNGMNISVQYYYGLTDITVDDSTPNQYNRSLYMTVGIPIGAGKAKEKEKLHEQK